MSLVEQALSRAASQFQNSPKVMGLIAAIIAPLDEALETANELKTKRWIDTAIGKQLDGCGLIVGESRMGRDDNAYRQAIRFRVFVNISQGTPSNLIRGLKFLVDGDDNQYLEAYPATAILFTDGNEVPIDIANQMQDLKPAGLSTVPVCVSYTAKPFRFTKQTVPSELFVNNGDDYLTANGSDIQISNGNTIALGARLGGSAPAELTAGVQLIDVNGSILVIHSPNHQVVVESGFHLTGVFQ